VSGEHSSEAGERAVETAQENERLALAIASGDKEAEQSFVLRYLPKVRAMLLARTRNPELAADLQQDVMIEAICALRRGQLHEAEKLSAFVLGIARNLLNSHFQGAVRQPVWLEFPDNIPDLTAPIDSIAEEQKQTLARRAIASLDLMDQSILQLTLVEGLKPGVIAQRLRLSPDVVRQRKVRATRKVIDFLSTLSQNNSTAHFKEGVLP
jgi:RNA polymerase sigma-70 factor (ECF subfamily)